MNHLLSRRFKWNVALLSLNNNCIKTYLSSATILLGALRINTILSNTAHNLNIWTVKISRGWTYSTMCLSLFETFVTSLPYLDSIRKLLQFLTSFPYLDSIRKLLQFLTSFPYLDSIRKILQFLTSFPYLDSIRNLLQFLTSFPYLDRIRK